MGLCQNNVLILYCFNMVDSKGHRSISLILDTMLYYQMPERLEDQEGHG